jgi:hypothetical protein
VIWDLIYFILEKRDRQNQSGFLEKNIEHHTIMLSNEERQKIHRHAYIPEHLPDYVETVSNSRAHFIDNYLCFHRRSHLIFNGYPLVEKAGDVSRAYDAACSQFKPSTVAVLAPEIWLAEETYEHQATDEYFKLTLPLKSIDSEVAYMVRRAEKEVSLHHGVFKREHKRMIKEFIKSRELSKAQTYIYKQIPAFLKRCESCKIIETRKGSHLTAFSILDLGSQDYAFYLFNFRSNKFNVPGASDWLFKEMAAIASSEGKRAINLGLGINPGIRRFKEKWGGKRFMSYHSILVRRETMDLGGLANKL